MAPSIAIQAISCVINKSCCVNDSEGRLSACTSVNKAAFSVCRKLRKNAIDGITKYNMTSIHMDVIFLTEVLRA